MSDDYYICRVGDSKENSHFDKTIRKPIINKQYNKIVWGLNKCSISKKRVDMINKNVCNSWMILYPNKPEDYPYAICKIKSIKERCLGPLIPIDETNEERGWTNGTSSGKDDFTYDIIFDKLYLLNKESFNGYKPKGQTTFLKLSNDLSEHHVKLYEIVKEEIKYIKRYVSPIIC